MKGNNIFLLAAVLLFLAASCKDPYVPKIKKLNEEIMVVEGFIDGAAETVITLSRAGSVNGNDDSTFSKYIANATVTVEDNHGGNYSLINFRDGSYRGNYNFNPGLQYRVKIVTADQKEYESQFVPFKVSPEIEGIGYEIVPEGARIHVTTGDPWGNSKYYRWKFEETWEFLSYYPTDYQFDVTDSTIGDIIDQVYHCWQYDRSKNIVISATENLKEDKISKFTLLTIPNHSIKLSYIYSINVHQYVMDSIGYNYYLQLMKNTEETGSIFDPQPGNLRGNIYNVNEPSEIVVGYIGAGRSYTTRQFFKIPWNYVQDCSFTIEVPPIPDSIKFYFGPGGGFWPIKDEEDFWLGAFTQCVDCRVRGSNVKPDYWP